jgi:hypothetical protein
MWSGLGRCGEFWWDLADWGDVDITLDIPVQKVLVLLILTVVITIAGLALADAAVSQYLSAFISLAALVISVVSAFKEDVFPFRPRALVDEVMLAPPTLPSHDSLALIVPVAFLNDGYGTGVIEGLTLKIEGEGGTKVYTPVAEIDYQKFISGKRALHAENLLGAFNLFRLGSRESMKKHILFSQEEHSQRYPFTQWKPGKYIFRLFAKHTGSASPVEISSVTHGLSQEVLGAYKKGMGASLSPGRELNV